MIVIIALIFANRSFKSSLAAALGRPKPALAFVLAAVGGILARANHWPVAQGNFRFGPLHADDLLLTLKLVKPLWRRI